MKQLLLSILLLLILKSCILFSDYNVLVKNQRFYYTENLESTNFNYFKDNLKIIVSAYPPSLSMNRNKLNTATVNVQLKIVNKSNNTILFQEMEAILKEQEGDSIRGKMCSGIRDLKIKDKDSLIINCPIIFKVKKLDLTNHKFILKMTKVLSEEKEFVIPQMIFNYYEGKKPL